MQRWMRNLAAALLGLACVIAVGSATAQKTVNLTFRFNDTEEKEMRAALDEFEKRNPGIKVALQRIGWRDARDQYLREAAAGQGPDVVHVAQVWVKEMGDAGALLPLNDLMKQAPLPNAGGFNDFVARELAQNKQGQIFGLPWTTDTWAMVYRTDVLKEAGITKLPDTWAELHDASAQITKRTGKAGFGFPAGGSASGAIWFLANYYWWSNGKAMVVQKPDGSYGMNLTAADIADSMRYFKSFLTEGHNPTSNLSASDAHDPAILQALVTGKQGIGTMPPNTYKQVLETYAAANPGKPLPFVSGPFPKGSVTRTSNIGGRMLGINVNSKNPAEAWKLVEYLASEPIFTKYYTTQFPAQTSLLKKVDFGKEMQGFAEQLGYARTWGPYSDGPAPIGAMWNATGRAFSAALSGQRTEQQAAEELLDNVAKLMKTRGQ
ncbi:MAG TPA: sugar ABC transporter substrate-binding protein [Casimicrobiaceae bacterium]|nr:sugar ABC transporter substrate-binding protein [Casimicrobiaceae bacterium]